MKTKLYAFSLHLLSSVFVFGLTAYLLSSIWYPSMLFWLDGGVEVLKIAALVDVVLGPCLTFIVWNTVSKPRPELKRDMSLILVFQLLALSYGAWTMYSQRPVFMAFLDGKIYSVTEGVMSAPPSVSTEAGEGVFGIPLVIQTRPAGLSVEDEAAKLDIPSYGMTQWWKSWDSGYEKALSSSILLKNTLGLYRGKKGKIRAESEELLKTCDPSKCVLVPLFLRYGGVALVLDKTTGKVMHVMSDALD